MDSGGLNNWKKKFEDTPDRRGTSSLKWGKYDGLDILPLWIADMDFKSPPEVIDAAIQASEFGNFGYAGCPLSLYKAVSERVKLLYDWEIKKSWIIWLPGMGCALNVSCRIFEKKRAQVISQVPIYPPFLSAPQNFGLSSVRVPMRCKNNRFSFDFQALEDLHTKPGDLFMLCHPHNPVGTAFTKNELSLFSDWILARDLYVCSDEIHCDLLLESNLSHFPLASISPEIAARTITLMAPSKTFNLPGFGCSYAIISDAPLRSKFKKSMHGIVPEPPAMGFALTEAAYLHGEPWRRDLLDYLVLNRELAMKRIAHIPFLIPYSPQATYLLWIDARDVPTPDPHSYFEKNGVGLSDGKDFGAPGFLRLNLGCSHKLLSQALDRMEKACYSFD